MSDYKALGVITARGGSKSVPDKNIHPFKGHPLIAWSVASARASRRLTDAIVSTDCPTIAEVARRYGADVPFMRPPELARDDTPHLPVMQHAIRTMEQQRGYRYDYVAILQPTSPLKRACDIDAVLDRMHACQSDAVLTVREVDQPHPVKLKKIVDGRLVPYLLAETEGQRRQDMPTAYVRNGCIYVVRRDVMIEQDRLYGDDQRPFVMDARQGVDIDALVDYALAEVLYDQLAADPDFEPFDEPCEAG